MAIVNEELISYVNYVNEIYEKTRYGFAKIFSSEISRKHGITTSATHLLQKMKAVEKRGSAGRTQYRWIYGDVSPYELQRIAERLKTESFHYNQKNWMKTKAKRHKLKAKENAVTNAAPDLFKQDSPVGVFERMNSISQRLANLEDSLINTIKRYDMLLDDAWIEIEKLHKLHKADPKKSWFARWKQSRHKKKVAALKRKLENLTK
jgi:hypothetical protein